MGKRYPLEQDINVKRIPIKKGYLWQEDTNGKMVCYAKKTPMGKRILTLCWDLQTWRRFGPSSNVPCYQTNRTYWPPTHRVTWSNALIQQPSLSYPVTNIITITTAFSILSCNFSITNHIITNFSVLHFPNSLFSLYFSLRKYIITNFAITNFISHFLDVRYREV